MALLLTGPAAIAKTMINDDSSPWLLIIYPAIVIGYILGGALAGRQHPRTAFMHGAASTVLAFSILQTVGIIRRLAGSESISVGALVFNALLASTLGVIGAWFGARRGTLDAGGGEPTR